MSNYPYEYVRCLGRFVAAKNEIFFHVQHKAFIEQT